MLDDARTAVVSCAAVALGTTEAAWTSCTGTATPDRALVFVTTVNCGATARDDKSKYSTINARAETVATAATYKEPFRHKRCIVPATGFYEPDKINYEKPPFPWHYFQVKDQKIFGFAGLYDIWEDKETGKEIRSYTIITTTPNELVGKYHNRMPVILERELEEEWLNPDIVEVERLTAMLRPYPDEKMEEWQVGEAARNSRNDYPELLKPI